MRNLIIAAVAAVTFAGAAHAKTEAWQVGDNQFHVYFGALDPAKPADRAAMLAAVERAASRLCANEPVASDVRACTAEIVARTAKTDMPIALALNERKGTVYAAK